MYISMLQYLVQVALIWFPTLIVLGVIYGFFNRGEIPKYKRGFVWGFFISLVVSVIAAILRLNTNAFIREYYNLCCLIIALAAEIFLAFSCFSREGSREALSRERRIGWAVTVITIAGFSYALPDLFLYPFEFAVGLDSFFHTDVLFKVIGYSMALILAVVGGMSVRCVLSEASDGLARKTLLFMLLFSATNHFVLFFQILMLRSRLMQSEILVNCLLFLLEYQHCLILALLFVVLLACLGCIFLNRKTIFGGENPAILRKRKADAKRRIRWSFFCILCLVTGFFIMTVGVQINNQIVELSPPVELAVNGGKIEIPIETVNDGHLHRFCYTTKEGVQVRYIVIQKSGSAYGVALDACDICGASGYYERNGQIVCILCDVVMNVGTIGMPGGCNPVPLNHDIADGKIIIDTASLNAEAYRFE